MLRCDLRLVAKEVLSADAGGCGGRYGNIGSWVIEMAGAVCGVGGWWWVAATKITVPVNFYFVCARCYL